MRAIRQSGSEGGGVQLLSLPYQKIVTVALGRRRSVKGAEE
jgi:hypothetical protein